MTKYKHIPTGDIYEKSGNTYHCEKFDYFLPFYLVENCLSKDWEKIEEPEKEYTVIVVINQYKGNELIGTSIESVIRKSDRTVFKVGQKVKVKGIDKIFKIEKFEEKRCLLVFLENAGETILSHIHAVPEKPVLFVTEDGKEIFDGDTYFWIRDEFQIAETNAEWHMEYEKCVKRFSTKEAAEEYVISYKPLFNFEEIMDAQTNAISGNQYDYYEISRQRCGFKKEE